MTTEKARAEWWYTGWSRGLIVTMMRDSEQQRDTAAWRLGIAQERLVDARRVERAETATDTPAGRVDEGWQGGE